MRGWQQFGTLVIISAVFSNMFRNGLSAGESWFLTFLAMVAGALVGWVFGKVGADAQHAKDCPYESAVKKGLVP